MLSLNTRLKLFALLAAIAVFAIACGGSKDSDATATSSSTQPTGTATTGRVEPTLPPLQSGASVIFVIDQGSGMGADFGGMTRWEAVRQAFGDNGAGSALGDLSERALIGATLFSGSAGEGGCPLKAGVSPGADNLTRIGNLVADSEPLTGSPVGDALLDAVSTLRLFPGVRTMVVITDGTADSCDSEASAERAEEEAIAGALSGYVRRIETKVIALGDDAPESYIQKLANAGIGVPPSAQPEPGEEPEFWRASDLSELRSAIEAVAQSIQPAS